MADPGRLKRGKAAVKYIESEDEDEIEDDNMQQPNPKKVQATTGRATPSSTAKKPKRSAGSDEPADGESILKYGCYSYLTLSPNV